MNVDPGYTQRNRASSAHIRALAGLSEAELRTPVGEHWTVAIVLAHLAFWDRRVLYVLEKSRQTGKLTIPDLDASANDISLPLWAAIPPQDAGRIAIETAEELDRQLEALPADLLEELHAYNRRWVERSLHREHHMGEAEAALQAARGG